MGFHGEQFYSSSVGFITFDSDILRQRFSSSEYSSKADYPTQSPVFFINDYCHRHTSPQDECRNVKSKCRYHGFFVADVGCYERSHKKQTIEQEQPICPSFASSYAIEWKFFIFIREEYQSVYECLLCRVLPSERSAGEPYGVAQSDVVSGVRRSHCPEDVRPTQCKEHFRLPYRE